MYGSKSNLNRHVRNIHETVESHMSDDDVMPSDEDSRTPEPKKQKKMRNRSADTEEKDEHETTNVEDELPRFIAELVAEAEAFYEHATSNRQKVFERDGLTREQAEVEAFNDYAPKMRKRLKKKLVNLLSEIWEVLDHDFYRALKKIAQNDYVDDYKSRADAWAAAMNNKAAHLIDGLLPDKDLESESEDDDDEDDEDDADDE